MSTDTPTSYLFPLFEHLANEHGLTLVDSEMQAIINVVDEMRKTPPPVEEEAPTFSYSYNSEDYHGHFATREDAAKEGFSLFDDHGEDEEPEVVYTARNVKVPRVVDAGYLIEQVLENTTEEAGEWSSGYLEDVSKEAVEELQSEMQAVWDRWEKKHKLEPTWFNCVEEKRHLQDED